MISVVVNRNISVPTSNWNMMSCPWKVKFWNLFQYWNFILSPNYENFVAIVAELTANAVKTLPNSIICVDVVHHQAWWRKTQEAFKTYWPQPRCSQSFTLIIFHRNFTKSYTNSIINLLPLTLTNFDAQYTSFANSSLHLLVKVGLRFSTNAVIPSLRSSCKK